MIFWHSHNQYLVPVQLSMLLVALVFNTKFGRDSQYIFSYLGLIRVRKNLENETTEKILKNLQNCLDYGHILGQFYPSTQITVEYSVERICKQYLPNLESTKIWQTKPHAKADNISINYL